MFLKIVLLIGVFALSRAAKPEVKDDEFFGLDAYDNDNFLDWMLLKPLFSTEKYNAILSPFVTALALGPAYEGSRQYSRVSMRTEFFLKGHTESPKIRMERHLKSIKAPSTNYTVKIGSKVFLGKSLKPKADYQETLKNYYHTDIESLDFSKPELTSNAINTWIYNVTDGHISDPLLIGDKIKNANMLIISAFYFHGNWRYPFTETFEAPFSIPPQYEVDVPFMSVTDSFYYTDKTGSFKAEALRMPFDGNKFAMTLLLPVADADISKFDEILKPFIILNWHKTMKKRQIKVTMPKFKINYTPKLRRLMDELDKVNNIFIETANMERIVEGKALSVTDFVQTVGIEVDEGIPKNAAPAVVKKVSGDILDFNINRPFLFMIHDEVSRRMVLYGKVIDPSAQ